MIEEEEEDEEEGNDDEETQRMSLRAFVKGLLAESPRIFYRSKPLRFPQIRLAEGE